MRVSIERRGPDPGDLVDAAIRRMTQASKEVGNAVKKAGVAAIRQAVPYRSFAGYPLKVKGKVHASGTRVDVDLYGTPVGFWSMLESGAKPHMIFPRKRKALHGGGDKYSEGHMHPGFGGRRVWSRAEPAVREAVSKVVEDTYDAVVTRG